MSTAFTVAPLRDVVRATLPALTNMFSPTSNACVVKVTPMKGTRRFRYDPYRASVLVATPEKPRSPAASFVAAPFPAYSAVAPMAAYQAGAAAAFAPYPMMPTMAPFVAYPPMMSSQMSSCEATPVPSHMPSRVGTPIPTNMMLAPVPAVAFDYNAAMSSSVSSIDGAEVSSTASTAAPHSNNTSEAALPVKHYAIVKFKHDTYPYEAPFRVAVGDSVIVQGDRGESIGTVRDISTTKPVRPVASCIVRKSTQKDKDQLAMLRRKEAAATKFCENAVKELCIDMSIMDTEYQFDQNKLSIYYKSKGMVDFRRLQRVLFREFRCRVWLVNTNELINDA